MIEHETRKITEQIDSHDIFRECYRIRSYRYDDNGQVEVDKFVWGITVSNYQNREKRWELTTARPTKS